MPASGGRSVNKARLKKSIVAAADELFQAHGFAAVTMEQIAAVADVSKRTLYKYFPAKEAVLAHLLEVELARDLAGLGERIDANAAFRDNVWAVLSESAAWCARHPDYLLPYIRYKFLSFDPNAGTHAADDGDMLQAWAALIAMAQQRGELDPARPALELAFYFHYLYLGALMRWLTDPRLDLQHEFATVVRLFVDGARAGAQR